MKPKCSEHSEKEAQAVCMEHRQYLCTGCLIKKEKHGNCTLHELSELTLTKENTRSRLLSLKETMEQKSTELEIKRSSLEKEKDQLAERIEKFSLKLEACIRERKRKTIEVVVNKHTNINGEYNSCIERIDELKTQIVDMLSEMNDVNISEIIATAEEIGLEVNSMSDSECIEPLFSPLSVLQNIITTDDSLGEIAFGFAQNTYDTADQYIAGATACTGTQSEKKPMRSQGSSTNMSFFSGSEDEHSERKTLSTRSAPPQPRPRLSSNPDANNERKPQATKSVPPQPLPKPSFKRRSTHLPPKTPPKPTLNANKSGTEESIGTNEIKPSHEQNIDKVTESIEVLNLVKTTPEHTDKNTSKQSDGKQTKNEQKPELVKEKQRSRFQRRHESEENVYQDLPESDPSSQMKERVLKLSPMADFKEGLRITQLAMESSEKIIALLSTFPDQEVVFVNKDGELLRRERLGKPLFLTSVGDRSFAVLTENDKAKKLTICNITTEMKVDIKDLSTKITQKEIIGLDFDNSSKEFAIISTGKVYTVKESGKSVKEMKYNKTGATEKVDVLKAKYDFSSKCLFILKVSEFKRVIKCYNFTKHDFTWKFNIPADANSGPNEIALYGGSIVILYPNAIRRLSKAQEMSISTPIKSPYMPAKAIGMCVMKTEDMAIITADSVNAQESITLGFVGL